MTAKVLLLSLGLLALATFARGAPGKGPPSPPPDSPCIAPYGIPLAPPVWLANFLLLYFTKPAIGAAMPAFAAPVPETVYECLAKNDEGCPWTEMAGYFRRRGEITNLTSRIWPSNCLLKPELQALSAPDATHPREINRPLGPEKAAWLAQRLNMTQDMILTPDEYRCLVGTPPLDPARQIIDLCMQDLTNTRGNARFTLASYGLSISAAGNVRSDCAPDAPCLEFNQLLKGPVQAIAAQCGFGEKLGILVRYTPFLELLVAVDGCQGAWLPVCIANKTEAGGC
jgi:hypothetical protein